MSAGGKGIGAGLFGKDSGTVYEVYLNLTPLMDVMSNLLFFLLASFGATMVAIMPTTVPTVSSGESTPDPDKTEDAVNVTLRADDMFHGRSQFLRALQIADVHDRPNKLKLAGRVNPGLTHTP